MSQNVVGELTTKDTLPKHHPLADALKSLGITQKPDMSAEVRH